MGYTTGPKSTEDDGVESTRKDVWGAVKFSGTTGRSSKQFGRDSGSSNGRCGPISGTALFWSM